MILDPYTSAGVGTKQVVWSTMDFSLALAAQGRGDDFFELNFRSEA